jgi:integral membrane protein
MRQDKPVSRLRKLALIEGISFLVILFVTMPLKYLMDMPMPNKVFGMAHGVLFMLYLVYLVYMWISRKWSFRVLAWGLAASILPFVVFWVEKKVFATLPAQAKP